jgi:serine/threonine protein kinase
VSSQAQAQQKICPTCNTRYGIGSFCARDGTPLVPVADIGRTSDLVGQVLADRYRLVRCIGEGGMGQVYEAQHVNINRRFAIKLLKSEIVSNPEAVARFRQEAWSASSIGHENIIQIDDFATLPNGSVYLAMEFLEGMSLAERMRTSGRLPMGQMLDIVLQTCRGLEAAHQKNIVHRDMKPENIFLVERNERLRAKILDFGIAKVSGAESSQNLTRTGTIFGTPFYMSPEQALGRPLDHRADIYSVGIIMYELFTGRVPFEAESFMGILTKHVTTPPSPPRQFAPDREIPEAVEHIILRAMAKELEERYATMSELLQDLEGFTLGRVPEVLASPPQTLPIANRFPSEQLEGKSEINELRITKGRPRLMWLAVAALALGGAIAAVWKKGAQDTRLPAESPAGTPIRPTAEPISKRPKSALSAKSLEALHEPERVDSEERSPPSTRATKSPHKIAPKRTVKRPSMVDPYERLDDKKGGSLMDPY